MAVQVNDELLTQVKTALRLSPDNFAFDEDSIFPMISACLDDLSGAGVNMETNPFLIRQAIVFYCKANFGLAADEKWQKLYEKTRDALGSRTAEVTTE